MCILTISESIGTSLFSLAMHTCTHARNIHIYTLTHTCTHVRNTHIYTLTHTCTHKHSPYCVQQHYYKEALKVKKQIEQLAEVKSDKDVRTYKELSLSIVFPLQYVHILGTFDSCDKTCTSILQLQQLLPTEGEVKWKMYKCHMHLKETQEALDMVTLLLMHTDACTIDNRINTNTYVDS